MLVLIPVSQPLQQFGVVLRINFLIGTAEEFLLKRFFEKFCLVLLL